MGPRCSLGSQLIRFQCQEHAVERFCCSNIDDPPDVADVGQQQGQVSQAQGLLLRGQAQLGDGPDQGVDDRVEEAQQLAPALQLLGRLRGAGAKICGGERRHIYQKSLESKML